MFLKICCPVIIPYFVWTSYLFIDLKVIFLDLEVRRRGFYGVAPSICLREHILTEYWVFERAHFYGVMNFRGTIFFFYYLKMEQTTKKVYSLLYYTSAPTVKLQRIVFYWEEENNKISWPMTFPHRPWGVGVPCLDELQKNWAMFGWKNSLHNAGNKFKSFKLIKYLFPFFRHHAFSAICYFLCIFFRTRRMIRGIRGKEDD